jgi:hypothetical protein
MRNQGATQRNWIGAGVVILAALLSAACGSGMGSSTGGNIPANLSLNASTVTFGSVNVGSSKMHALTLTNSSASDGPSITFTKVSSSSKAFTVTTASLPIVLAPGKSSTINIKFAPKAAGTATGSLSIAVDGATDPASVPLSGDGVGSTALSVSPSTLSFGTVTIGSSKNQSGTLTAGTSSITVSNANWSGQGYSVSGISFPVTIAAGKSVSFAVTFTPGAAGGSQGSISFASNAPNSPTVENFSGTGAQPAAQGTDQHVVDLAWAASSSNVLGYNTYRSTQSGGPYTRLTSSPQAQTSYSDASVAAGQTYYYVVTSVDSDSLESAFSNQATASVPTP